MSMTLTERHRIAGFAWLATVSVSLCLFPALDEKAFLLLGALATGLLVGLGMLLRTLRVPAFLVLLVQLVMLLEMMLLGYGRQAKWLIVPTEDTIRAIQSLVDSGSEVARTFAAPAPPSVGLTMMMVFFIALIGVLVDFCAVGLSRVPLAGLPLLAMYTVPVAVLPDGVPVLGFIPGAVGFIALLMVAERERLAHWGRLVARGTSAHADGIDTSGLSATGRRVSVLAITGAVILPIFVPVLSEGLFGGSGSGPGGGGDGDGGTSSLSFDDPMVSLANSLRREDPVDVLSVESRDGEPSYLRMAVLDNPGPDAWRGEQFDLSDTIPVGSFFPRPPGLAADVPVDARQLAITPTEDFPSDSSWLPIPYNITTANLSGDWAYLPRDQTVTATEESSMGDLGTYEINYNDTQPTPEQLQAEAGIPEDIQRYTDVPDDVPSVVRQVAQVETVGATSDYERALMLQSFFHDDDNFTYSLEAGYGYGYGAMGDFLSERQGFCQHFAATMAMMARELGIPSRVVVGFLQPATARGDDYVFTSHDVHAWPELYFEGVGWTQFEPTPSIGAPFPDWAPRMVEQTGPGANPTPSGIVEPSRGPNQTGDPSDTAAAGPDSTSGSSGGSAPSVWWLIGAGAVLVLASPALMRWGVRRARINRPVDGHTAAESAWRELRDHILDLRLAWTGSMTPRARGQAVEPLLEGDEAGVSALNRLALSVERARYARTPLAGADPAGDAREVMAVISRGAEWPQRLRALVWPSSLIPDIRVGWAAMRTRLRR